LQAFSSRQLLQSRTVDRHNSVTSKLQIVARSGADHHDIANHCIADSSLIKEDPRATLLQSDE
jgi:hypothetical protein